MIKYLIVLLLSFAITSGYASPRRHIPIVWFQYGNVFDMVCAYKANYTVRTSWVNELNSKLPEIKND